MHATEKELIRDYIVLPIAISIAHMNRLAIAASTVTLRDLYAAAALVVINRMRMDMDAVRRGLKAAGITVNDTNESRNNESVSYPYVLRGKRYRFTMSKSAIDAEVERRLARYVADAIKPEVNANDREVQIAR